MVDILVVEDNKELRSVIERFLLHVGYHIHCVDDGEAALSYIRKEEVRLLLVDINLGSINGFQICEEVRKSSTIPIIIMSARTGIDDQVLGYDIGADDYVEKPFKMEILLAKIKALLRRGYEMTKQVQILKDKDLTVDTQKRLVLLRGESISLSIKEYELLVMLMKHKGTTLTKTFLFERIWGDSESELSTLTVHMNTLREKIEQDVRHPKRLCTVWGIGYRYEGME